MRGPLLRRLAGQLRPLVEDIPEVRLERTGGRYKVAVVQHQGEEYRVTWQGKVQHVLNPNAKRLRCQPVDEHSALAREVVEKLQVWLDKGGE